MGKTIVFVRKAMGLLREVGPFSMMAIAAEYTIAGGIYNYTMWRPCEFPGANHPPFARAVVTERD